MHVDKNRLQRVDDLLRREVEAGNVPGAVYAVGLGQEVLQQNAIGYAENMHGVTRPMHLDTMFDLASLTKVMATLACVLILVDNGDIRLNDPVGLFLPNFLESIEYKTHTSMHAAKSQVTVRHLLTHTSGLPAHRPFYAQAKTRAELIEKVVHEPLQTLPDAKVVYSDLDFILLGELIASVTGMPLERFAHERVFQPLSMAHTMYCPPSSLQSNIAATEEVASRNVLVGVVHDENARAMGGISGHAGLFAPLSDVIRYVTMWLSDSNEVLSPAVRKVACACQTNHLSGRRGLGWACRYDGFDHTGDLWPFTTVGHTGFTGTSIAMDLPSGLWTILLTNEVHFGREDRTIGRLRQRVHNLVAAALLP